MTSDSKRITTARPATIRRLLESFIWGGGANSIDDVIHAFEDRASLAEAALAFDRSFGGELRSGEPPLLHEELLNALSTAVGVMDGVFLTEPARVVWSEQAVADQRRLGRVVYDVQP